MQPICVASVVPRTRGRKRGRPRIKCCPKGTFDTGLYFSPALVESQGERLVATPIDTSSIKCPLTSLASPKRSARARLSSFDMLSLVQIRESGISFVDFVRVRMGGKRN